MRSLVGAAIAVLAIAGCGAPQAATSSPSATTSATISPEPSPSASASASPIGSPTPTVPDPKFSCKTTPVAPDPLVLMAGTASPLPSLIVLDVKDPLHPTQACVLSNANSGRFISGTKIVFWYSTFVGTADLQTGSLFWNRAFLDPPLAVSFSPDGTNWAWTQADASGAIQTHLVVGGKDQVVLSRAPIGGHGGVPWGPVSQVEFSASGQYLLTYTLFADVGGQPNFIVYALDGSVAYKSKAAKFGVWDRAGSRLYFLAGTAVGANSGTVMSWDPGGAPVARSPKMSSYFWPRIAPDGKTLVFNTYNAQGFPHPWQLVIASHARSQLSSSTSSVPVFVSADYIWSSEGVPCVCGPMGTSQADGRVIAHNIRTGVNSVVLELARLTPSQSPTSDILDVWFG